MNELCPALISSFVWPNFPSRQTHIPYRRSQTPRNDFLFPFFTVFFLTFLMRFSALKTRKYLLKTLAVVNSSSALTLGVVFYPDIACNEWLYLKYSNCTPFFPRENDGELNITVRLSRDPTRFWVKCSALRRKFVKMRTFYAQVSERESI